MLMSDSPGQRRSNYGGVFIARPDSANRLPERRAMARLRTDRLLRWVAEARATGRAARADILLLLAWTAYDAGTKPPRTP
jgi:hypothetical protein